MRTIPSELLNRVKKKWQVPAENADPKMKVYLSRGLQNELFQVFTIQEGELLTDVDVTVSRPSAITLPATAYALAINNGLAQVKSKPLPYDDQYPWEDEFDVATGVTSVAIEFDGYWDRDYNTGRFNFVTEEHPWMFYVQAGNLYMQYWQDTPELLVAGVAKCAAVRGWVPANGATHNDQGLIIAYLKADGKMYYRSYAMQENGIKGWEGEREVTPLGSGIYDLALFRTNDFRVGFLAEVDGNISWTLSERNWAGMSLPAERFSISIGETSAELSLFEITVHPYELGAENFSFHPVSMCALSLYETEPGTNTAGVDSAWVVDAQHVAVRFNCPTTVWNPEMLSNSMSLGGSQVVAAEFDDATRKVVYTLSEPLGASATAAGFSVTISSGVFVLYQPTTQRTSFLPGGEVAVKGILAPTEETFAISLAVSGTLSLSEIIVYTYTALPQETFTLNIAGTTGAFTLTDTEVIPV